MKFFKKFNTTAEYEAYASSQDFTKPNLSYCVNDNSVKSTYYPCENETTYVVESTSYSDEVPKEATSNTITISYVMIETHDDCSTNVTSGTDTHDVTFDANTGSTPVTINGSFVWNGNNVPYSFTQEGDVCESSITYTVTSVTNPSKVNYNATSATVVLNWQSVEVTTSCTEIIENGTVQETVTFTQNPWDEDRIVSGTISWCGTTADYMFEQGWNGVKKFFDVTYEISATTPMKLANIVSSLTNNTEYMYVQQNDTNQEGGTLVEDGWVRYVSSSGLLSSFVFSHVGTAKCRYLFKSNVTYVPSQIFSRGDLGTASESPFITKVEFHDALTSIASDKVFMGQTKLTNETIVFPPNSVIRNIGKAAFHSCTGITSFHTLPDSLRTLSGTSSKPEAQTFNNCYSMSSLTIPSGVTSINKAFVCDCASLKWVKFLPTTPPTITSDTFWYKYNSQSKDVWFKIYVPTDSLTAYKTASNWTSIESHIYPMSEFVDE